MAWLRIGARANPAGVSVQLVLAREAVRLLVRVVARACVLPGRLGGADAASTFPGDWNRVGLAPCFRH